jgi:hypothetical protein
MNGRPQAYVSFNLAQRAPVGSTDAAKNEVVRFGRIDEWHVDFSYHLRTN